MILLAVLYIQFLSIDLSLYTDFCLSLEGLLLLPLGLVIGVQAPVMIHNCVHGNVKIKWCNQVFGETCGVYVLLGMAAFELNHHMHHVHFDTDLDPHNPEGKSSFHFSLPITFLFSRYFFYFLPCFIHLSP